MVFYFYLLIPAALVSYSNHTYGSAIIKGAYLDVLDEVAVGICIQSTCCGPYIEIWRIVK